jgi:uncharacterized membrane protein
VKVLLAGESWSKLVYHQKGFDHFVTSHYEEGATDFVSKMRSSGIDVTWMKAHEVPQEFPSNAADLASYDVVLLSDIGSNSFYLSPDTFDQSRTTVDRLELLARYVEQGGGLVMVGGYMSFTGIDGKARFGSSALADVLPVTMLPTDDRVERPAGVEPKVVSEHAILEGLERTWPSLLGYNRFMATESAEVLAKVDDDPLLVVASVGQGRTAAFASDLAPHWAPAEFVDWQGYTPLWTSLLNWASGSD